MNVITAALIAFAATSSAPPSHAASQPPCVVEFRGCASQLQHARSPAAALKCVEGFQACALECAPISLCRDQCDRTSPRMLDRLTRWFGLGSKEKR
jgi:hypothetical protein